MTDPLIVSAGDALRLTLDPLVTVQAADRRHRALASDHRVSAVVVRDRVFVRCACGWTFECLTEDRPRTCGFHDAMVRWHQDSARLFTEALRTFDAGEREAIELQTLLTVQTQALHAATR